MKKRSSSLYANCVLSLHNPPRGSWVCPCRLPWSPISWHHPNMVNITLVSRKPRFTFSIQEAILLPQLSTIYLLKKGMPHLDALHIPEGSLSPKAPFPKAEFFSPRSLLLVLIMSIPGKYVLWQEVQGHNNIYRFSNCCVVPTAKSKMSLQLSAKTQHMLQG